MTTRIHIPLISAHIFRAAIRHALPCLAAACLCSCSGSANIFDPLNVDEREDVYKPVVGQPGEVGVVSIHELIRHKRGDEKEYEIQAMFEDEEPGGGVGCELVCEGSFHGVSSV